MSTMLTNGRIFDYSLLVIAGGDCDGVRAESLRLTPLRRELERMGVPGLEPHMGKHDLLTTFHRAVEKVADEKIRSPEAKRPMLLSETVSKQASALIAAGHAGRGNLESNTTSSAQQRPIASTSVRG